MVIGQIGLGEKGFALAQELISNRITVVAYDPSSANRRKAADNGIVTTSSVQAVLLHLPRPRMVFCVLNPEDAQPILFQLGSLLTSNDMLVMVGFSSLLVQAFQTVKTLEVTFTDVSIKVKGNQDAFEACQPIMERIAKGRTIHFLNLAL